MRDFAAELREPQFMAAEDARRGVAQLQGGGVEPSLDAVIRSTSHPATAVGVLSAVWATMSATLVSLSWPMPVRIGRGNWAMWAQRR